MATKIVGGSHCIQIKRDGEARIVQLGAAEHDRMAQYRRVAYFDLDAFTEIDREMWMLALLAADAWNHSRHGPYYTATTKSMDTAITEYGPWRACNR